MKAVIKQALFAGGMILSLTFQAAQAAQTVALEGNFVQGGMVIGKVPEGATVQLDSKSVRVGPHGHFVIGFGRDHKKSASLRVTYADKRSEILPLKISPRSYKIQRINGLPQRKVTPNPKDLARIIRENKEIAKVRTFDSDLQGFREKFRWPVKGIVSGVFGSQRILNGEPRRPHYGIDIAAPAGTPVISGASGVIALAEKDLFYTGGTVMIDHGHGITAVFSHLKDITVQVGQVVTATDQIGTVGSTGRSTGPHLDWRVNWFKERLDPQLLLPPQESN